MSITFNQAIAQWSGAPPITSGAFTPNAAGDTVLVVSYTNSQSQSFTFSGTGGTYTNGFSDTGVGHGYSVAIGYCLSVASGSQTITIASGAGFGYGIVGLDFFGAGSIGNLTDTYNPNPGAGAGACVGASIAVPSGSVLVAVCIDISNLGTAETMTSGGTTLSSNIFNQAYLAVSYAGSGSSIQPTFTCPQGAANFYVVLQAILTPPGSAVVPTVGSVTFAGAAPNVTPANANVITPLTAWKKEGRILVPDRKIFLPEYRKAA